MIAPREEGRATLAIYLILSAAIAFFVWSASATSQPPTPSARLTTQPEQPVADEDQNQPNTERGSAKRPLVIRMLPTPKTEEETAREEEQTTNNRRTTYVTYAVAVFTGGLILVGLYQWQTYEATLGANIEIQRAYIDSSPEPPGIEGIAAEKRPTVRIKIHNYGKTPGHILAFGVGIVIDNDLPSNDFPLPKAGAFKGFFLMSKDDVWWWADDEDPDSLPIITADDIKRLGTTNKECKLWVLSYVDYRDQFGRTFRNHQCRAWNRKDIRKDDPNGIRVMNLDIETRPGYNMDYEIGPDGKPKEPLEKWRARFKA